MSARGAPRHRRAPCMSTCIVPPPVRAPSTAAARLKPQGVTAPHLEESLGKAAVRARVKGAKERCGAVGDCAFGQMHNRANEGGQVRGLDVDELLVLRVEEVLELIHARWPTQDVDVRLPVLHARLGIVPLPRDARFCRVQEDAAKSWQHQGAGRGLRWRVRRNHQGVAVGHEGVVDADEVANGRVSGKTQVRSRGDLRGVESEEGGDRGLDPTEELGIPRIEGRASCAFQLGEAPASTRRAELQD
mmetsp:Transcript_135788/g.201953  ORF Transcript_135788/g.201953 Transcript_135788/m.201953 type:complete len:246 (-) Transcript_135788:215-952(-)